LIPKERRREQQVHGRKEGEGEIPSLRVGEKRSPLRQKRFKKKNRIRRRKKGGSHHLKGVWKRTSVKRLEGKREKRSFPAQIHVSLRGGKKTVSIQEGSEKRISPTGQKGGRSDLRMEDWKARSESTVAKKEKE